MLDYKKQRNKRIAELQKKNKEISEANKNNSAQILALIIKNGLLEKQNKELQEQIEKMKISLPLCKREDNTEGRSNSYKVVKL